MDSKRNKKNDRPLKRSRNERQHFSLDFTTDSWFPKFLILHSEDQTKPLAKVSPFTVARVLEEVIGKSYKARKLSSGDVQVEVQTKEQSSALQSLEKINELAVTVTVHRTLNIVKGVISVDELIDCTESEIEEGLKEQGVVSAKRIVMRREGKEIPTRHIILSFQRHTLPADIKAGYLSCTVRAFVPNPRRCFKCQRFGHSSQVCRGQATCPKCSGKDHTPESCKNEFQCTNCQGAHPVYSRSCPRWQQEKQILKIKTEQNLSYTAAKAQFEFKKKGTFSDVVCRGVAPLRVSVETQTPGSPLCTPQQKLRDTDVSPPNTLDCREGSQETATTSDEVDGTPSVWDGATQGLSQSTSQNMDVDDDDCLSQKSSSSLSGVPSLGKEKRERTSGRGRGTKTKETQKMPPPRITPP